MAKWSEEIEAEITSLLKDWLKQQGKTQKDLRDSLNASSERMPVIIEVLKDEYHVGGISKIASMLCAIEESWAKQINPIFHEKKNGDPFSQLDLLLEEIKEDCNS